jgi:Flp pilus assembly protein TadG
VSIARLLLRCRRGVAALEFAILLPMLLVLLFGVAEISNMYAADRRVILAAQSCADLVAQEKAVDSTKLDDIASAVQHVMNPLPALSLSFRVTSVTFDATTGAPSVGWDHTVGAFNPTDHPTPVTSAAGLGLPGESVIVVDLSYRYTPLFTNILPDSFAINELAVARPRRVRTIACNGC